MKPKTYYFGSNIFRISIRCLGFFRHALIFSVGFSIVFGFSNYYYYYYYYPKLGFWRHSPSIAKINLLSMNDRELFTANAVKWRLNITEVLLPKCIFYGWRIEPIFKWGNRSIMGKEKEKMRKILRLFLFPLCIF